MSDSKFTETQAVRALSAKGCKFSSRSVDVPAEGLGIKSLAKLDYLVNWLEYRVRLLPKKNNPVLSNGGS
jgi:hypothetical protein